LLAGTLDGVHSAGLVDALARVADGPVLTQGSPAYEQARQSFNALVDRRPYAIVQPRSAAGVAAAVMVSGDASLPVAIRGGGHSVAGHGMAEDALVIDLRLMRGVHVDPDLRVARAEGGALWLDVDGATAAQGLATPGGTFADTGVAGLALGGGIGHLVGSCGLTCDNLLAADLVIADGRRVRVDAEHDPELLWGLRGAGGNFGVVTAFEFGLHDVTALLGGRLVYPRAAAGLALRRALGLMDEAPPGLVLMPLLSRLQSAVIITVCYRGDPEVGEQLIRPLRNGVEVLEDSVRPCSYLEMQATNGLLPFGLRNYWKGHFVREVSNAVLEATIEEFITGRLLGSVLIEPISGKARREPEGGAAFGQREARYNVSALAIWEDPGEDSERIAWARAYAAALEPSSLTGGGYLNYSTEETADRVHAAFGEARFARLAALKAAWDPGNRFRFNHNIPPSV
jgi:FAD/FMN-containing dehydrogenase